jgi:uncharacterized protein (DUF488 family)
MTLWTIGHSTRTLEEFVTALRAHEIDLLADVRSFPTSARHPHFDEEVLAAELPSNMETEDFQQGVDKLLKLAENRRIAYMCAERLWWRCHRSLISDYLTAIRGVEVIHIHDEKKSEPHRLHRTARVEEGHLVYDVGESGRLL